MKITVTAMKTGNIEKL